MNQRRFWRHYLNEYAQEIVIVYPEMIVLPGLCDLPGIPLTIRFYSQSVCRDLLQLYTPVFQKMEYNG